MTELTSAVRRIPIRRMTRNQKITEIMTRAGVMTCERVRAARNYKRLPVQEINRRLKVLRAGKDRIDTWHRGRLAELAGRAAPASG